MPIASGPPPIPYRARNKETDAQLANARVGLGISWKSILAIVLVVIVFIAILQLVA